MRSDNVEGEGRTIIDKRARQNERELTANTARNCYRSENNSGWFSHSAASAGFRGYVRHSFGPEFSLIDNYKSMKHNQLDQSEEKRFSSNPDPLFPDHIRTIYRSNSPHLPFKRDLPLRLDDCVFI